MLFNIETDGALSIAILFLAHLGLCAARHCFRDPDPGRAAGPHGDAAASFEQHGSEVRPIFEDEGKQVRLIPGSVWGGTAAHARRHFERTIGGIQSSVLKWRAVQDETGGTYVIEVGL